MKFISCTICGEVLNVLNAFDLSNRSDLSLFWFAKISLHGLKILNEIMGIKFDEIGEFLGRKMLKILRKFDDLMEFMKNLWHKKSHKT